MTSAEIPLGLCQCGCGGVTRISEATRAAHGYIKGRPRRYVDGHYARDRYRKSGERLSRVDMTIASIFARCAPEPNTGCWLWTGPQTGTGKDGKHFSYGTVSVDGQRHLVHRVSYEVTHGPVPLGLVVDHICNTPLCVNPDHLQAITQKENTHRGCGPAARYAKATTCLLGHPLVQKPNSRWRYCKVCKNAADRVYRASGLRAMRQKNKTNRNHLLSGGA